MAISGKFVADFESFYTAVQKAEVSLRSFESGAGKVETSLNRVTNSLSGTKIIQEATIAAEAVERIGGVSKLTEAELSRLSAQAKEAAAKMAAMGVDVPPGIQKIADATKNATDQTASWKGALTAAAGAFGVAFSVGAVVQFGKSVFDSASQIGDLASQLGVSTDAVQGFKFAAEQSGSTLDAVGTAITKMNANLDGGDKATVEALKKAGLGFSEIRSMKPEDAFLAITDAIQKIPDPMTQSDVALKLFGKSAAQLLPAIKDGFRGVSDSASKMSDDTIKSLKSAQDAWNELGTKVTIVSGTIIAAAMDTTKQLTKSTDDFVLFAERAIKFGVGVAGAMAQAEAEAARAGKTTHDVYLGTAGAAHKTAEEIDAAAAAAKRWADQLDAAFRKWSGKELADQVRILDITFQKLASSGQLTQRQFDDIAREATKLAEQGAILTPILWDEVIALGALDPTLVSNAEAFARVGTEIDLVIPKLSGFNQAVLDLNAKTVAGFSGLPEMGFKVTAGLDNVIVKTRKETDELAALAQAFSQLSQIADGSLGAIVRDFGTLVASADTAKKSIDGIKGGFAKGGFSGILEATTGMLGLTSAAIAAGKAIASLFDRNKGRDLVVDFAASFGGFDALQAEMMTLGADYDRLWRNLTQLGSNNDPKAAQAAIDAVTAALDRQKSKTAEAAQAAIESGAKQAQAQQDTLDAITSKYAQTISQLDSEYKSLNDSVSAEAEEAVMGLVETQQRARMDQIKAEKAAQEAMRDAEIDAKKMTFEQWYKDGAQVNEDLRALYGKPLEIPYYYKAQNSPDGGGATYVPPTSGGGGAGATSVTVVSVLDGDVVSQSVARRLPGILTGAGR
jgi:hypothetical protein